MSRFAICSFDRPSATSARISRSRSVSSGKVDRGAVAVQAKKSKAGAAISNAVKRTIKPGKTAAVKVTVKPAFRELVDAMTYVDARKLSVAHTVKSKKVGKRTAKKPARPSLSLKVRIKN